MSVGQGVVATIAAYVGNSRPYEAVVRGTCCLFEFHKYCRSVLGDSVLEAARVSWAGADGVPPDWGQRYLNALSSMKPEADWRNDLNELSQRRQPQQHAHPQGPP